MVGSGVACAMTRELGQEQVLRDNGVKKFCGSVLGCRLSLTTLGRGICTGPTEVVHFHNIFFYIRTIVLLRMRGKRSCRIGSWANREGGKGSHVSGHRRP